MNGHSAVGLQNGSYSQESKDMSWDLCTFSMTGHETVVNSWTQWGKLEEVVVGALPEDACFPTEGPDFRGHCNNKYIHSTLPWPKGLKHKQAIKRANAQYDQYTELMEGEGITVRRPTPVSQNKPTVTPNWSVPNQYNCCPRDKLIVVGSEILEASMSLRCRFFEEHCYRDLLMEYYRRDRNMIWTAAPKPIMSDKLYRHSVDVALGAASPHWDMSRGERTEKTNKHIYSTTEAEPIWDAADITRMGKDIFVHHSNTTNRFGFEWIRRHMSARGITAHLMHFRDDTPSHIDCTFVPLRPGLVLTNPERPVVKEEVARFREGNWKFVDAPKPADHDKPMPDWCQSTMWLSMNVLLLSSTKVVCEENEKELQHLLEDLGFDVLTTPFRDCFEFGGSLHCATVDIRRDDEMKDFFAIDYN